MSAWTKTTLGEVCREGGGFIRTGPFGSQLHQSDYVEDPDGIPVVMPKDMRDGRIDESSVARTSNEIAQRLAIHLLEEGDIVLSRRGDVGRTAWVSGNDLPVLCGTGSMRIHLGDGPIDRNYFRYFMRSKMVSDYLEGQAVGATMPNINAGIVEKLPVEVPPWAHQLAAASLLGSLDDLIENTGRRIELLEHMAQALYREWFVHFRYPGHEGATFVDSRLGRIPKRWKAEPLAKEYATLDRTSVQPQKWPEEHFDHYSIPAFDAGQLPTPDLGASIRSGKYVLTSPAIMVSKLNPRIERTWFAEPRTSVRSVTSTEFLIIRPRQGHSLEFVYALARSERFQGRLRELSGGTSTSHQRSRPEGFLAAEVVVPNDELSQTFGECTGPSLALARALRTQRAKLAQLRDLLLPRLVTGRIDISDLDLDALIESVA